MADQTERAARLLVCALHYATDACARPRLHDLTEVIAVAVARGWLAADGDSVCLTDAGRDLVT